jgi:hypothetical protein
LPQCGKNVTVVSDNRVIIAPGQSMTELRCGEIYDKSPGASQPNMRRCQAKTIPRSPGGGLKDDFSSKKTQKNNKFKFATVLASFGFGFSLFS